MPTNKKLIYGILAVGILIIGVVSLFMYLGKICLPGQIKYKMPVVCFIPPCPPVEKCISITECNSLKHHKVMQGECVALPKPECGWLEDYKQTNVPCKGLAECYNINPFYRCCESLGVCLDYTEANLKENPEMHCAKLNEELCIEYNRYCKWEGEECETLTLPKRNQEVIIATDKTEYEQGEVVKIAVKNGLNKSVWYVKELCPTSCCDLHKWENNERKYLGNSMPCILKSLPQAGSYQFEADELKPGGSISKQWDMKIATSFAESGKYRFSFFYGLSKDNYTEKTIYSNEFTIKEKTAKSVIFPLFKDAINNPKGTISIDNIDMPLDSEEACEIAKKSCGSTSCLEVKGNNELPKDFIAQYKQFFGNFNWVVGLKPVCSGTAAYISEYDRSVVCWCAYE